MSTERSSKGRSFHADGPTIEKALRCIIAKWARGTKNSPLEAERSTRRAARTDTGQSRGSGFKLEPCAGRAAPPPTICGRRRRRLLLIFEVLKLLEESRSLL